MSSETKTNEGVTTANRGAVDFVHLHNHTHYSLLDGLQKIPQLLDQVEALGQKAVAITDHGTLSGAIEFYKECTKRGIKPIIGMEAYVAPRKHTDKNSKEDRTPYHLTLLAKNEQGYKNLMKLSTIAWLDGFYYKPRIDRDLLEKYHEGLICLSGCIGGELGTHILNGDPDDAMEAAEWYKNLFGVENYYLEVQPHIGWKPQDRVNAGLQVIAKTLGLGLVATGDAHYTKDTDHYTHDILLCVQTGSLLEDPNRMKLDQDLSVRSGEFFAEKFPDLPEAISNTVKIAEMCDLTIELGQILIPKFDVPEGETEKSYLRRLVFTGAAWRYLKTPKEDLQAITEKDVVGKLEPKILERIEYELGVIGKMGYEGYFLIVADLINWSKNNGIICGPGRGSAAGSIVAYLTNITDLDPLEYDLLFERFLNPDRISMPDIDMDYADDRREEVIAYATEKYGQDRVAQIITFGTMAARNAVRDTGRVLGMPYGEVDAIAKLIPAPVQGRHIPLAKSIIDDQDLSREYNSNPRAKNVIDVAMQLEGTIRNTGTHAAGVVIAPEAIVERVPLTRASKGGIATQYAMGPVEELGLLKFDFLGLSNLTIIKNTLRILRKVYDVELDPSEIPIDDKKTYELLAHGDTTGVFQLESSGMKRYLRELKPDRFEDIIAMCALYRPGPLSAGLTDSFVRRKNGLEEVTYDHPSMKSSLDSTYGVLVYQEQVMQFSRDVCGFSGGEADTLRKAIGKKNVETMTKMKAAFIEGGVTHSEVPRDIMERFWDHLLGFADYCFNKSHSACYGLIAVQTAYLKAHYPAAFMAALMTSDYGNLDRIAIEVTECRKMGLTLLPPDVNESFYEFAVVPGTNNIRFGLAAVKNVGSGPIAAIIAAREEGGPFAGVEDFAKRVEATYVNRKTMESLIRAGAFDSMGDRDTLLNNVDKITSYATRAQKNALTGQIDIFGAIGMQEETPPLQFDAPATKPDIRQHLLWEKELLGLYISSHPLDEYDNYLYDQTMPLNKLSPSLEGRSVHIGGIITMFRKITTKTGSSMAFVGLESKDGEVELIVFPRAFDQYHPILAVDSVVEIEGKVSSKDRDGKTGGEVKILLDKVKLIDIEKARKWLAKPREEAVEDLAPSLESSELFVHLDDLKDSTQLIAVKKLLETHKGTSESYLVLGEGAQRKLIKLPYSVALAPELLSKLNELLGSDHVVVKAPQKA